MFQKLDFYGRANASQEDFNGQQRNGSVELPSHMQDTIELELRSQLDNAKSDLTQIQQNIENKIKMEINKYPQFA